MPTETKDQETIICPKCKWRIFADWLESKATTICPHCGHDLAEPHHD